MERYPPIPPSELKGDQVTIHHELLEGANKMFKDKGFVFQRKDGALVGPFAPIMYTPLTVARQFFALFGAIATIPGFPPSAREAAIIAVGALFECKYEVYAHEGVAATTGALSTAQIEKLAKGERPQPEDGDPDTAEGVVIAYDVAVALVTSRGPLKHELWKKALENFGKEGAAALIHYVGAYCYTCMILNGADVPVPESNE